MRLTVLAGGVGGARFAAGVRAVARDEGHDVTVVANTGDDLWLAGVRVCPDLDSLMYALGGANDTERGWGRAGESERVAGELAAYGVGWPWFTLGDLDLGTHLARTSLLREGRTLTEVTRRLAARWDLGVDLVPATDDEVETWVETANGTMHFEEWWVRTRAAEPALRFVQRGVEQARIAPAAERAIAEADVVLVAPSNPVVSIGTILGIPGVREALAATPAPVVGLSPVIGGAAIRGMAEQCLAAIGLAPTADAVAGLHGARRAGGVLDGWLVDEVDAALVPAVEALGIRARAVPLWMRDEATSAAMVRAAIELARG